MQPEVLDARRGARRTVDVAVIDENDIFRRGVVTCLATDPMLRVVFEAPTGPITGEPHVAVLSEQAAWHESVPGRVLVCADDPRTLERRSSPNRLVAVLARRALTEDQLLAAVRAAAAGLRVDVELEGPPPVEDGLPRRSVDILRLLAAGAGTREISKSIGYSERTIKTAIQEIERRLGARSRGQAVAEAIRLGLI